MRATFVRVFATIKLMDLDKVDDTPSHRQPLAPLTSNRFAQRCQNFLNTTGSITVTMSRSVKPLPGTGFVLKERNATEEYRNYRRLDLEVPSQFASRQKMLALAILWHRFVHGVPSSLPVCFWTPRGTAIQCLEGGTLSRAKMSVKTAARVARHLLGALKYLNRHRVVHRDICPANIGFSKQSDVMKGRVVRAKGAALFDFDCAAVRLPEGPAFGDPTRVRYASVRSMITGRYFPVDDCESLLYAVLEQTDGVVMEWRADHEYREDDNEENEWAVTVPQKRAFQRKCHGPFRAAFAYLNDCEEDVNYAALAKILV